LTRTRLVTRWELTAASFDAELEAAVATGLSGVAVFANGREAAAGLANVETGEPVTPLHRFRVASVTKVFIATVVLQLVAEGALALDGDAAPLVPGSTIRQLLNHTSGLPNADLFDDLVAFFEPYRRDAEHRWEMSPHDLLARAVSMPRPFPPGEGWAYSGSNYLALGLLVEETTGASLRQELRRRIVEPLGLAGTDLPEKSSDVDGLARAYLPPDNPLIPGPGPVDVTTLDLPFNWAGGGIVSVARDVARFLRALLGGELLPSALRAEMLRTVPSDWPETDGYGLGIGRITSVMGRMPSPCGAGWGHLGLGPYTAIALASEDGGRQAVVFANGAVVAEEQWDAVGRLAWAGYCG
jgi:D-alanyl-D-alanine carboxypeptidase